MRRKEHNAGNTRAKANDNATTAAAYKFFVMLNSDQYAEMRGDISY